MDKKKILIAIVAIVLLYIIITMGNGTETTYECPEGEYVNCMPPISEEKVEICNDEAYKEWAQENCGVEFVY